jgi:hypothetical protein
LDFSWDLSCQSIALADGINDVPRVDTETCQIKFRENLEISLQRQAVVVLTYLHWRGKLRRKKSLGECIEGE